MRDARRKRPEALGVALAACLLVPACLYAQGGADFLFHRPTLTLGVHGGWSMPTESSDVFEFVRERLTVDDGDFASTTLGGEISWRATERLDVSATVEYAGASVRSEFRDWVDQDDNPIEQTTELVRVPVTLSVKGYLFERGRAIGRYAWVPNAWSPYAGAGVGIMAYDFEQHGDFVDFETLDIFRDRFESKGSTPTGHVLAGVQVSLSEHFLARAEYRHYWASAELEGDFVGFEPIDLGGGRATIGLAIRP